MPFNRPYTSRRRFRRRRPMRRTYNNKVMTVGKVKRIISAELKLSTVANDFLAISVALPMVVSLTGNIAQGDTNLQRTGNWIQPITYHGYVTVRGSNNAVEDTNGVRIMILRWKNDESVDPALVNKVVEDPADPFSSFKFTQRGAFTILYSRVFNIVHKENNPQFLKTYRFKIPLSRGQKTLYDGAIPKKYQLFFMAFSDSLTVGEEPELSISSTLRWTDS